MYKLPDQAGQQYIDTDTTTIRANIEKDIIAVVYPSYYTFNSGDVTAGSGTGEIPNH